MHQSHSTLGEREVPVRDFAPGPEQPKIVRIITRLNIGGPSIHTLLLTRELRACPYRTVLLAGSCDPGEGDMRYLVRSDDPVCWVPELSRSVRPMRNLKALWRLWRLLRRERPAIVHTHTAMAGCLGRLAALLSGVPIVIHTFHGNSLAEYFSPVPAAVFRRIEQFLARFTDILCVVSPQQAHELAAKFHIAPARKFRVIPLGLDLDDYVALRPPKPDGLLVVGWFGRMVPVKNVPLLAATMQEILARRPDIRFLIAGDGPERHALDAVLARHPDRARWLGWQHEILPVMARCHVVLQTSRNEGTPVALIQGMAAARPFVSTAVGGVVDMVAGVSPRQTPGASWHANGVLANSDAGALADALAALADDRALSSRMGLAARAFAAEQYRKETIVKNMDALYRELLQSRRKP
ncbi:MAG: glycosyltransferase [Bryobacteraceae bacterium]|jgi:glycosyltransferase involved in cell wall biosynthesis